MKFNSLEIFPLYGIHFIADTKKVYGTVADKEDNLVRRDGGPFSEKDFFQNPGEYKSVFYEKVSQINVQHYT